MLAAPAAASQLSFDRVGIEVRHQATIAATATNTAVHVPWLEIALRPIDTLRMAEPATNIQSEKLIISTMNLRIRYWNLTEEEDNAKYFFSDPAKHDPAGIVNSIYFGMAQFEAPNDVVRLRNQSTLISESSSVLCSTSDCHLPKL